MTSTQLINSPLISLVYCALYATHVRLIENTVGDVMEAYAYVALDYCE